MSGGIGVADRRGSSGVLSALREGLVARVSGQQRGWSGDVGLLAVLAVVGVITQLRDTSFAINIATSFGLFAILVGSLQLMLGYTNQASLAQGAVYGLGAYVAAYLETAFHVPVGLAFGSALLAGILCGLVVAVPLMRLREHFLALGTLAVQVIGTTLFVNLTSITGGANGLPVPDASVSSLGLVYVILGVDAAVLLGLRRLRFTRWGRALLAVRADETMASSMGVNVPLARVATVVVAFGMASSAGFLFGQSAGFIAPDDFSLTVSLSVLVAMIVGGSSITWGTLVGAGAYSLLEAESTSFPGLAVLILGVFLVVVLGYFPRGLSGIVRDLSARVGAEAGSGGIRLRARSAGREGVTEGREAVSAGRQEAVEDGIAVPVVAAAEDRVADASIPVREGRSAASVSSEGEGRVPGDPILAIDDLYKSFGGVKVLRGVTLTVERRGEVCAVLGQNGAGKTTLLNIVAGLVPPDSGSVRVAGSEVIGRRPWQVRELGVARTFQAPRLLLEESCFENVMLGRTRVPSGAARGIAGARAAVLDALEHVGLAEAAWRPAGSLSYGARRVLEIARCLVMGPRLLLLDEPGAGLSEGEEEWLAELLTRLARSGVAILVIEHRMKLVASTAERVVMLDSGVIVFDGTAAEALASPVVKERYLGRDLAQVSVAAVGMGTMVGR